MVTQYIDKDGVEYELQPSSWNKGDSACHGCVFKFGNSEKCKATPTCTPNNNGNGIQKREWIGKHLVWKVKSYIHNI